MEHFSEGTIVQAEENRSCHWAGSYQPKATYLEPEPSSLNRYAPLFIALVVSMSAAQASLQLGSIGFPISPEIVLSSRAPSIGLSLSDNRVSVLVGSAAQVEVRISLGTSRPFRVSLAAQSLPSGVAVFFSPSSAKPPFSSVMTIVASEMSVPGVYNITIVASGGGLTSRSSSSILIVTIVHDIAVIHANGPATAAVGSLVLVNTTIANFGSVLETFRVNLYSNESLVAGHQSSLTAGGQEEITLAWNTTDFAAGRYTLVVSVPPVSGESDLTDNTRNAGTVTLEEPPSGNPNPPAQVPSSPETGLFYGRALAIAAAIGEILLVALILFQGPIRKAVRRFRHE